jgi:hypothetical protein
MRNQARLNAPNYAKWPSYPVIGLTSTGVFANDRDGLESRRFTKILLAGSDPAANFAKKPGIFHEDFVFPRIAQLKAKIVQIAQVFVMTCMRHTCLCHRTSLLFRKVKLVLLFYAFGL